MRAAMSQASSLLISLLIASAASAVTMAWTYIGNTGNPADTEVMGDGTTGYGSVPYAYYIGTYEVTNAQYVEFLNAKAASDPLQLYDPKMGVSSVGIFGAITRTGSAGELQLRRDRRQREHACQLGDVLRRVALRQLDE